MLQLILLILFFNSNVLLGSANLTLFNYHDRPVIATAIPIKARDLYATSGIKPGSPLVLKGTDGETLITRRVTIEGTDYILVYTCMQAGEQKQLEIKQVAAWPNFDLLTMVDHKDVKIISNGLVTLKYTTGDRFLEWIMGSEEMNAGLTEEERSVVDGIRSVGFIDLPEEVTVSLDGNKPVISIRREINSMGRELTMKLDISLAPYAPVFEYRITYVNKKDQTINILRDENRIVSGSWKAAMDPMYLLTAPTGTQAMVDRNSSISWRPVYWKDPWITQQSANGHSFMYMSLAHPDQYDAGERYNFGYNISKFENAGVKNQVVDREKPIIVKGHDDETLGTVFGAFGLHDDPASNARKIYRQFAAGNQLLADPPVAWYLDNGRAGSTYLGKFSDDFHHPDKWQVLQGRFSAANGKGKLSGRETGEIAAFLESSGKEASLLSLDVESLKGALEVLAVPLPLEAGKKGYKNELVMATMEAAGKYELDVNDLTGWTEKQAFALVLRSVNGTVQLKHVDYYPSVPSGAPQALFPAHQSEMTDVATSFKWKLLDGCSIYEIQYSQDPDFPGGSTESILKNNKNNDDQNGSIYALHFSEKLMPVGRNYWRVRGISFEKAPSDWSRVHVVDVNNDYEPVQSMRHEISPDQPLFILRTRQNNRSEDILQKTEGMRKNVAIALHYASKFPDLRASCDLLGEAGGLVVLSGGTDEDRSLSNLHSQVEYIFQHCPNVIGKVTGELTGISDTYLERMLILMRKYGCRFHISTIPRAIEASLVFSADDYKRELLKKYRGFFTLVTKPTNPAGLFYARASTLGMFITGISAHYGFQNDSFGWVGVDPITGEIISLNRIPVIWFLQNWMLAASKGGDVFVFENGNLWSNQNWNNYFRPFIEEISTQKVIPSRKNVLERIKVVIVTDDVKTAFAPGYGDYAAVARELYGYRLDRAESWPKNDRFYALPVVHEKLTSDIPEGILKVPLSTLRTGGQVHRVFDGLYPSTDQGEAFVTRVGESFFILNSHDVAYKGESYSEEFFMDMKGGNITCLSGLINEYQYIMGRVREEGNGIRLQVNAECPDLFSDKTSQTTTLNFTCRKRPRISVVPETAVVKNSWNEATGQQELQLIHQKDTPGSVIIELD